MRLGALTMEALPSGQRAYVDMGSRLVRQEEGDVGDEVRIERATHVLTAGVVTALARTGWRLETRPGHTLDMVYADHRLVPRTIVSDLASGATSQEQWGAQCAQLGLTGIPLTPSAAVTSVG